MVNVEEIVTQVSWKWLKNQKKNTSNDLVFHLLERFLSFMFEFRSQFVSYAF